ncbi:MAG: NAD(P)/FAD-dependent oxidoreductase [Chloroflexi bacterium]|nr:NAD(P)/FAD-dependent oxidoreductase [Chloroflexota bacterium]
MAGRTVVVLGAGLGGLTAVNALRPLLPREHRIVLVDKRPTFAVSFANLWVMTGERADPKEGERSILGLAERGVEVVVDEVQDVDLDARTVRLRSTALPYDYLVVALGADYAPEAMPGFTEAAYNLYDADGAHRLQGALADFEQGRVVVLITKMPFKCPAAPYEAAFLVDALLKIKGVRDRAEIAVYTPEPQPMPVAGPAVGEALAGMLKERGIPYYPRWPVQSIDAAGKRLLFGEGREPVSFDLLIGIPPHVAPKAVRGLLGPSGWIPVDAGTLETKHAGVFAIGDVATIMLKHGLPLPKAGVFASGQAEVVARIIAARVLGRASAEQFDGQGFCYIEVADGLAAYGDGNFYADPAPAIKLFSPTYDYYVKKREWEKSILRSLL